MASSGDLRKYIRDIPDFPTPGIVFKDIMPLLRDSGAFQSTVEQLSRLHADVDLVCGIDARGFILAGAVALEMGVGFVPIRKKGKLPGETDSISYLLEYGEAELEMQADGIQPGQQCLIVDDVIATGGTAAAAADLIFRRGGLLVGYAFLLELAFLQGVKKLPQPETARSLVVYD